MSIENELSGIIPEKIKWKIRPCQEKLAEVRQFSPDYPHNPLHLQQVGLFADRIATCFDLSSIEQEKLRYAIQRHDSGYAFVEMGILKPEEHHLGSTLIAFSETSDPELARGIFLHNSNVLPKNTPDWVRILRDADRMDRTGWYGVIFHSYYLGFRHPLVTDLTWQNTLEGNRIPLELLRDNRLPEQANYEDEPTGNFFCGPARRLIWTDYESQAEEFCRKIVLPFLHKNKLLDQVANNLEEWSKIVDGVEAEENDQGRYDGNDELFWKIQPIMCLTKWLIDFKEHNTLMAINTLRAYPKVLKESRKIFEEWENGIPQKTSVEQQEPEQLKLTLRHIAKSGTKMADELLSTNYLYDPEFNHEVVIYYGDRYQE